MERWRGIHKLTEEAGELLRIIGKLNAFPNGQHPSGDPIATQLLEELTDLQAAIDYFIEENGLAIDPARYKDKLIKYDNWFLSGVHDVEVPQTIDE